MVPPIYLQYGNKMPTTDYIQMVNLYAKPGVQIVDKLTPLNSHIWHMGTGIAGEAAELLGAYDASMCENQVLDVENVVEELGDIEFFLSGLRVALWITRIQTTGDVDNSYDNYPASVLSIKLVIECGNLLDLVKKKVVYNKEIEQQKFIDVLTRIESIMYCIRIISDISHEEVIAANKRKLNIRHDNSAFTDEKQTDRADKEPGQ